MNKLIILSYNIHKGFSSVKKFTLHRMRDEIRQVHPDLIFIQEVHGAQPRRRERLSKDKRSKRSALSQFEFLAHDIWPHFSYGQNATYTNGHHGNAILSKYPILSSNNLDLSSNRLERRGLLHATIQLPSLTLPLNIFCTHLNLLENGRKKQLLHVSKHIRRSFAKKTPLILAGDFNDWRQSANKYLKKSVGLDEAFENLHGDNAKTFPSAYPLLPLDRIYFRGLDLVRAQSLTHRPWRSLSDHVPIVAEFILR
jgi:endonuclease/exonuclease/phosphatase family metal-dependent hydrolase